MAKTILLIETDGYSITVTEHTTLEEAQIKMAERYEEEMPDGGNCYSSDSILGDLNAVLYTNAASKFLWKIYQ